MRKRSGIVVFVIVALALVGYLSRPTQAQSQVPGQVTLADVVAEIRQLRAVTEENGKQQVLASMLLAQQGRIQPISNRLFETRKDIEETDRSLLTATTSLRALQATSGPLTEERTAIARHVFEEARDKMAALRSRESDLASELGREEAAWADLMAQLQRSIRR
jgi:hypothetical protein